MPRLHPPDARALLRRVAPALDEPTAARVLAATGGNPLFLSEVGALLAAGQNGAAAGLPVPPGLREAIRSRLRALPPRTRALVDAVAVLGGDGLVDHAGAVAGIDLSEVDRSARPALEAEVLVAAGDRLYITTQEGETVVLSAGPALKVLARNALNETTRASVAISNGDLFIRTYKHLWCIGKK